MTEIIFCERKKLTVKDFDLFVANSDEKFYALSRKIIKIQRFDNGEKLFCGALQGAAPATQELAGVPVSWNRGIFMSH